jgi:hypothetical protein
LDRLTARAEANPTQNPPPPPPPPPPPEEPPPPNPEPLELRGDDDNVLPALDVKLPRLLDRCPTLKWATPVPTYQWGDSV